MKGQLSEALLALIEDPIERQQIREWPGPSTHKLITGVYDKGHLSQLHGKRGRRPNDVCLCDIEGGKPNCPKHNWIRPKRWRSSK